MMVQERSQIMKMEGRSKKRKKTSITNMKEKQNGRDERGQDERERDRRGKEELIREVKTLRAGESREKSCTYVLGGRVEGERDSMAPRGTAVTPIKYHANDSTAA